MNVNGSDVKGRGRGIEPLEKGAAGAQGKEYTHFQVVQHDASKRVVQLEHLVHDTAEGPDRRARRSKVVDKPPNERVGRGGRHVRQDTLEEQ